MRIARRYDQIPTLITDTSDRSNSYFRITDIPDVFKVGENIIRFYPNPETLKFGSSIKYEVINQRGELLPTTVDDTLDNLGRYTIRVSVDLDTPAEELTVVLLGSLQDSLTLGYPKKYENIKWVKRFAVNPLQVDIINGPIKISSSGLILDSQSGSIDAQNVSRHLGSGDLIQNSSQVVNSIVTRESFSFFPLPGEKRLVFTYLGETQGESTGSLTVQLNVYNQIPSSSYIISGTYFLSSSSEESHYPGIYSFKLDNVYGNDLRDYMIEVIPGVKYIGGSGSPRIAKIIRWNAFTSGETLFQNWIRDFSSKYELRGDAGSE